MTVFAGVAVKVNVAASPVKFSVMTVAEAVAERTAAQKAEVNLILLIILETMFLITSVNQSSQIRSGNTNKFEASDRFLI